VSFLLDTNIVSDLRSPTRSRAGLLTWFADQTPDTLFVSVITLGEIRQGIEHIRRCDGRQARVLGHWLDELTRLYGDRVLPIDGQVAEEWGRLRAIRTLPVVDSLLAATARVHNLRVVTRNEKDFSDLGVTVLNPR
jgi:predicted nucleic acid-binding protein